MTLEEKIDTILKGQGYITKMLESLVMDRPTQAENGTKVRAMLAPLLNNPMFQKNPAMKEMFDQISKNLGG